MGATPVALSRTRSKINSRNVFTQRNNRVEANFFVILYLLSNFVGRLSVYFVKILYLQRHRLPSLHQPSLHHPPLQRRLIVRNIMEDNFLPDFDVADLPVYAKKSAAPPPHEEPMEVTRGDHTTSHVSPPASLPASLRPNPASDPFALPFPPPMRPQDRAHPSRKNQWIRRRQQHPSR